MNILHNDVFLFSRVFSEKKRNDARSRVISGMKEAMIRWMSEGVKNLKKRKCSRWVEVLPLTRAGASDYRMSRHNRDRQAGHLTTYSSDVDTGRGSRPHGHGSVFASTVCHPREPSNISRIKFVYFSITFFYSILIYLKKY